MAGAGAKKKAILGALILGSALALFALRARPPAPPSSTLTPASSGAARPASSAPTPSRADLALALAVAAARASTTDDPERREVISPAPLNPPSAEPIITEPGRGEQPSSAPLTPPPAEPIIVEPARGERREEISSAPLTPPCSVVGAPAATPDR